MHVAVTAVGADRPGIVSAVTGALFEHGGNIEDSRMAILGGHFSMMLIVALADDVDPATLEHALQAPARELDLVVAVRPVAETPSEQREGAPYVVSVYGADRPGIVHRVSSLLADRQVNISDLATHVVGSDPPVYVMLLEVVAPAGAEPSQLDADLTRLAEELGIDVSIRPMDAETL